MKKLKIKRFIKHIVKRMREYLCWLFLSPQVNIWRLEKKKIKDVPTILEIKQYQKHLRRKTFKIFLTGAAAIMLVLLLPGAFRKYFAQSKTYFWSQTDWSGGSILFKISGTTDSEWNTWRYFWTKSNGTNAINTSTAGQLKLGQTTAATTIGQTGGTYAGVFAGTGTYYLGNTIKQQKREYASCGSSGDNIGNNECIQGKCLNNAGNWECAPELIYGHHLDSTSSNFLGPSVALTGSYALDTTIKQFGTGSINFPRGTISYGTSSIILGPADWTITLWTYLGAAGGEKTVAGDYYALSDGTTSNVAFFLNQAGSMLKAGTTIGGTRYLAPSGYASFSAGWVMYALVWTNATKNLHYYSYNGTWNDQGSATASAGFSSPMTYVGGTSTNQYQFGHMDELLVFDRALTSTELQGLTGGW